MSAARFHYIAVGDMQNRTSAERFREGTSWRVTAQSSMGSVARGSVHRRAPFHRISPLAAAATA
jgi:hypothetical protein